METLKKLLKIATYIFCIELFVIIMMMCIGITYNIKEGTLYEDIFNRKIT